MSAAPTRAATDKYAAIPLESVRVDTLPNFDMYTAKTNGDAAAGPTYVLYRKKDVAVRPYHLRRLIDGGVKSLYIKENDRNLYRRYLEANLDAILHDETVDTWRKTEVVCESAVGLVADLYANPGSPASVHRAKSLVASTADLLLAGRGALRSFITTMSRDHHTYAHSVNVCIYVLGLAGRIEMDSDSICGLGLGALFHDIGMTKVDRRIIEKSEALDSAERVALQRHTTIGADLLQSGGALDISDGVLRVVAEHHEKCDGSGYPQGLEASEIHPWARITAVADVFDDLTCSRPWRKGLAFFEALKTMRDDMEGAFDKAAWRQFVEMLGQEA